MKSYRISNKSVLETNEHPWYHRKTRSVHPSAPDLRTQLRSHDPSKHIIIVSRVIPRSSNAVNRGSVVTGKALRFVRRR
ncbi:hypothetical protein NPIL_619511 [Nephila pilipes]|uniref:Uncharacterized protein n=1 Tax=Nephila pilipes TaxID=299642 RepID=A0A8X6TPH1_NEPPI|nr:hypothetical protein NPIL_619511 [Nephila pilipes]